MERLPDQLRHGLHLIFVGTAAGQRSADLGHYYAHPGNRFWRTIHAVGLTPRLYQPHEFPSLLALASASPTCANAARAWTMRR
jgi:double-stranded uracil-DNA glycosylase